MRTPSLLSSQGLGRVGGMVAMAVATACLVLLSCTTAEVAPPAAAPPEPPPMTQVPHPSGYTISDLGAVMLDPKAPKVEELKNCDADFRKLSASTRSKEEQDLGVAELVQHDPVGYHWCFYHRLYELELGLKKDNYIDERQKRVIDTYAFLVPIAKAFMARFHDSRYLRWAVYRYRRTSEWVFYRRLELTPKATSELIEATNPFGLWREPAASRSVLEKYKIVPPAPKPVPEGPPSENTDAIPPGEPAPVEGPAPADVPTDPNTLSPKTGKNVEEGGPSVDARPEKLTEEQEVQ